MPIRPSVAHSFEHVFLLQRSPRWPGQTTMPPSVSRMFENVGASTSRNPKGLYAL
jgi:hypothetical protein